MHDILLRQPAVIIVQKIHSCKTDLLIIHEALYITSSNYSITRVTIQQYNCTDCHLFLEQIIKLQQF